MGYLAKIWCRTMHDSPMWPSHGHYQCRTCGREYPVPWELDVTKAAWRRIDEKLLDTGTRTSGRAFVHAAQMTRPS
jgi:hypothetical protein